MFHQPVRMHVASVGISKVCFLFSLALCGLLFLLIPSLKAPAQHVDWPRPRAQIRPQPPRPSSGPGIAGASDASQSTESTTRLVLRVPGQKVFDETESTTDENHGPKRSDGLKGDSGGLLRHRSQDLLILEDIFIAVKTTRKYHMSRLELLIKTWISQAKEHVRNLCWCSYVDSAYPILLQDCTVQKCKCVHIHVSHIDQWHFTLDQKNSYGPRLNALAVCPRQQRSKWTSSKYGLS